MQPENKRRLLNAVPLFRHSYSLYQLSLLIPVCGCETWFLTLREEHSLLKTFEKAVPRKMLRVR
jgi:hypothetical protein